MGSKTCTKCGKVAALDAFYAKHAACKDCIKSAVAVRRMENLESVREYDRKRALLPHRKEKAVANTRKWRQADKRHTRAQNAAIRAIKSGALVRQPCVRCAAEKVVAHHEDYDRPLDVMWLCQPCHKQRHKEMRATQ